MRVKFVSKTRPDEVERLWQPLLDIATLPDGLSVTFDPDARDYDYLIVYEDLPPLEGEKKIMRSEPLACAPQNTMLITTEPSSIRIEGPNYLRQFGCIWSTKPSAVMPGVARIPSTPPLRYFYGRNLAGGPHRKLGGPMPEKTKNLSAMCSRKAMNHTLHSKRLDFVMAVKDRMGDDLALFGRGFDTVDDKAEAMDDYRYHIAIENHVQSGHATEKLTDCFLSGCLPFYYGDPDYDWHLPKEAVIPIDIFDVDGAIRIITQAIANHEYEKRLPAIKEARRLALSNWNTVEAACNVAVDRYEPNRDSGGGVIHGRHAFRKAHPIKAVQDALFVARMRRSRYAAPLQLS